MIIFRFLVGKLLCKPFCAILGSNCHGPGSESWTNNNFTISSVISDSLGISVSKQSKKKERLCIYRFKSAWTGRRKN